jgi:beta-galactosidase
VAHGNIEIQGPKVWSTANPELYSLRTVVSVHGQPVDDEVTPFGYRTIRFDAEKGFLLNGEPVKLKGTCNHQDHAGVGVAVPDSIQEFRIRRLLEMGTNAYRCAHNPPAPSLLDACDRLGMLVMDENRNFGGSPEHLEQLRMMVRRDRNHPSIILWSICNEEAIQGTAAGANIARAMQHAVRELDSSRPVTAAVSGGILNDTGIGNVVEVMGINYQLPLHDPYHARHPQVPLFAAETHCVLSTRGTYETNESEQTFASYDKELAPWGATAQETWSHILSRPFVAGFFAWTGFDYRGEPTPHVWPCVNSHFGIMDTCGFAKDSFFLHKALMTSESFVHLLPHWNWPGREGTPLDVVAYTNCDWAELFLNGKSLGRQRVDPTRTASWKVPYQPGVLKVVASNAGNGPPAASAMTETTGRAIALGVEIHPTFDAKTIPADERCAVPITVFAVDAEGKRVPTANNLITFSSSGPARILGVGNGNPTCHEPDKGSKRSLFHGLAQIILQTTSVAGEIALNASADGLPQAILRIRSTKGQYLSSVSPAKARFLLSNWRMSPITPTRPDVNQRSLDQDVNSWDRIDPGAGSQEAWKRSSGYAIYRVTCKLPKALRSTGGCILFREIVGEAEVYLDGTAVGKKSDASPGQLKILFRAGAEQFVLSVLIHADAGPAGIVKHVEMLAEK